MTTYKTSLAVGDSIEVTGTGLEVTRYGDVKIVVSSPAIVPPPDPDPVPTPSTGNILGVDFAKRPQTGDAWTRMLAASKALGPVTLTDTGGAANGELLAAAFVAAATNDGTLKQKVVAVCKAALNGPHARTLEQARNLAPIAIALDAIGYAGLDPELKRERDFKASDQGSVIDCHMKRPNNWGTCSGLARIAVSAHLGDTADLTTDRVVTENGVKRTIVAAVKVHKGWLGDRAAYSGFAYGDTSWQVDASKPVGINPRSAVKSNEVIDGVLPDDQRRANPFPKWSNENYVWQALGEVSATQFILRASGYPDVFGWGDAAVARAYARYAARNYGCSGDDGWQYAAAKAHGVTIVHFGFAPGKSFGWADWLYG